MREFICSEPLEGASYGHTELYFINGSFVLVSERWGSVDDAASWEESETVTKDIAIDWVRRNLRDEKQLKDIRKMSLGCYLDRSSQKL